MLQKVSLNHSVNVCKVEQVGRFLDRDCCETEVGILCSRQQGVNSQFHRRDRYEVYYLKMILDFCVQDESKT